MGFRLEEKRIRRAGLDYWQHLQVREVTGWEALQAELPPRPPWVFSRFAKRPLWSASLQRGDVFLFGSESRGLPAELLDPEDPRAVRLPTRAEVRSLNLATTVGIALYELLRQVEARERSD
jgi:tRNA (cytidine/uridine-2'-O-)-methyltransferase